MDLQQLRMVAAVEAAGSISAAARALYMGQPNVSKAMKEIEAEAGFAIFVRTHQGVAPTPRGREFLQHVHSVLLQIDALSELLHKDAPTALHLAAPGAEYLYDCFARYLGGTHTPAQEISYKELPNDDVIEAVTTGAAELGVLHCEVPQATETAERCRTAALECTPLWLFRRVLLLAESHPLAQEAEIDFSALQAYTEVQWAPGAFRAEAPHAVITVPHPQNAYALLHSVPGSYMWGCPMPARRAAALQLTQLPCPQAPCVQAFTVQHTAHALSEPAEGFLQLLRATVQALPQAEAE